MTREIKFRAWNNKSKVLMYDVDILYSSAGAIAVRDESYLTYSAEDEITQFTGLKDKNGKEIYEGDIVEFEFTDSSNNNLIGKGIIGWDDSGWCIKETKTQFFHVKFISKVIGNKFENSELLK